ncbi:MAG: NAD-dependent epimerase/dehydratase family protein [Deltaproteobacteria bacterium]|nr:MAG: NAD-dependent epimerase/dehydratase family protein [Deltaproteobacteria bacterium]
MKILVTGAAGQLSRLVSLALAEQGHEVLGLDLRPMRHRDFPGPFERVKRYDHRQVDEVFRSRAPDVLLHLGIRAGGFQAEARQRYTQNVLGTRHLLSLCRRNALDRVVVLGTYHVYGAHPNNPTFIPEDAPLRAVQNFPELLDAVELDHTVTTFLWQHKDEIPTVLLRPVNIMGPHLRNQVSTLLRGAVCPRLLGFNPMQQFLHESDLVRALVQVLEGSESAVYNLCGEGEVPWRRAIQIAGARELPLPHTIAYPAIRLLSRLNIAFPEHLMDFFRYPVIISDDAIRSRYPWRPEVSVVDTLRSLHDVPPDAPLGRSNVAS